MGILTSLSSVNFEPYYRIGKKVSEVSECWLCAYLVVNGEDLGVLTHVSLASGAIGTGITHVIF